MARGKPRTLEDVQRALFADLAPTQAVTIERFLAVARQTGRCLAVTDLDESWDRLLRKRPWGDAVEVLAEYLAGSGLRWCRQPTPRLTGCTFGF